MEAMMGVKETFEDDVPPSPPGFLRRWLVEFPALAGLIVRSTWNFYRRDRLVHRFDRHFERCYGAWSRIDFEKMPPHEILNNYRTMERKMLWNWKAPIINDFFVMVFYGILRKMCASWCGDSTGSLQNGLLCGDGQLESAAPADHILHLTQRAADSAALRSVILEKPLAELPQLIASHPDFSEFHAAFDEFLDLYGLRCVDELKLESRSYRDEPEQVYQLIRSYLKLDHCGSLDAESRRHTEQTVRQNAERHVDRLLRAQRSWLPRRAIFNHVLAATRRGIRDRERMRLARTRIYGVLRSMLRALGIHLHRSQVLDSAEDIFYLTIDEVWDFIQGTAVTTQLSDLVAVRRAEYDHYRTAIDQVPDNRFETSGVAYLNNSFQRQRVPPTDSDPASSRLKGLGCCPGIVEDGVQVVVDPKQTTHFTGGILVAERTDPGWVPIYPAFRGILIERGSVLSHSAIVAREFGIPTIVAIHGLTQTLRSGQRIRMNGETGDVEILETAHSSADTSCESTDSQCRGAISQLHS
jgi:pyruvate,water dikinase